MRFAICAAALVWSVTVSLAADFAQDPSDLGAALNARFSAQKTTSRLNDARCKQGPYLKSCIYSLGGIEIVAQGKPQTGTTSKITVSLTDVDAEDIAQFMIGAVSLVQMHSPAMSSNEASYLVSALTKEAAAEGKASKIIDGVYYSVMRYSNNSQIDFFVMPE